MIAYVLVCGVGEPAHAASHAAVVQVIERPMQRLFRASAGFLNFLATDMRRGLEESFGVPRDRMEIIAKILNGFSKGTVFHDRSPENISPENASRRMWFPADTGAHASTRI
jgi:hypothetical protein